MSIDSARDSGIGENSNFTDLETENSKEGNISFTIDITSNDGASCSFKKSEPCFDEKSRDMRGYWQPKVKRSLADRLPHNTFHLVSPSRYIFPGAEVFYDPDEKSSCLDEDESSSDTMSECC